MERRYCLTWIRQYDVLEFWHILLLRQIVLELHCGFAVVLCGFWNYALWILELRFVVLELHFI